MREKAAWVLGEIKDLRSLGLLISLLKDENDRFVQVSAVRALGELKDTRAIETLIGILENNRLWSYLKELAASALQKITGQGFGEDPMKWREWLEKNKEKYK